MEIIAGGASSAPKRWSFPALATEILNKSWYSSTPLMMAARTVKKRILSFGESPGSKMLSPSSVQKDQLLCLPLPLTPSNGFSCSKHTNPW